MTNEELAKELLSRVPLDSNSHDDLREAAARLRLYGSNLFVETACEEQQRLNREITKLRQRLKVAEDALEYAKGGITSDCAHDCRHFQECGDFKVCLCEQRINNAIAAIAAE